MSKPIEQPEKLDLASMNIAAEKRDELMRLFPEVQTEGGKIDFERLKSVLGEMVDAGRERYGMNWPGKAECMRTIQAPSMGTLLPMPEESVDWDTTENVIIEGDNLEVLKLLQKSYLGKVKMIYIDPPYNTGKDFIYPDNFNESLQTYLEYTGQVDSEGRKFGTNSDTGGRFHSKWINMIYPRLFLARSLLKDDGAIFVSIDEAEHPNLRLALNEVFGEENFIADFVWAAGRKNDSKHVSVSHEYIVCYVKNIEYLKEKGIIWRTRKLGLEDIYSAYNKFRRKIGTDNIAVQRELKEWFAGLPDTHPAKQHKHYSAVDSKGIYFPADISWPGGGGPKYQVLHPSTGKPVTVPSRGWMFGNAERMAEAIAEGRVHFGEDETAVPCIKSYLREREEEVPYSVFYQDGRASTKRLRQLFGEDIFENPKDEEVLQRIIEFASDKDALIVDLFAGSGTTAHAVMAQNAVDGGTRRFVLVQLPEPTNHQRFKSIAEITRERVRLVAAQLRKVQPSLGDDAAQDLGYRAFQLAPSNFVPWDGTAANDAEQLAKQLHLSIDHTRQDRTPNDLLFEVLLKSWGEPALSLKIAEETIEGVRVFLIADGAFLICLEEKVTLEFIRALAARKPDRVVMRESAFAGNDQLKANAVQTFKSAGVTSFKVV